MKKTILAVALLACGITAAQAADLTAQQINAPQCGTVAIGGTLEGIGGTCPTTTPTAAAPGVAGPDVRAIGFAGRGIPSAVTPTANATGVTVGAGGKAGVITGTSSATTSAGAAMTFTDTPTMASGATAMTWTMSGTICDGGVRGLASGQGDCP